MASDDFFKDEHLFLQQQSGTFVDTYPHAAQFLTEKSHDPDVDRTLEGFAFLTGQLHEKIENEYPQLIQGLVDMLWPHYLSPTPSMTIIEFTTTKAAPEKLTQGIDLHSAAKKERPSCSFQTSRDVTVVPACIKNVKINNVLRYDSITIEFELLNGATLSALKETTLRFYLGDNVYTSGELYLWLLNYLDSATLSYEHEQYKQPQLTISPVGFKNDEAILRYPQNSYVGYRLLQEYLCFPEGYLFVDINTLSIPEAIKHSTQFSLNLRFTRPLSERIKLNENSIKLNCTPAINLFSWHCEPINLDGRKTHYSLETRYQQTQFYEIFSIDSVTGWINAPHLKQKTRFYSPFENFKHQHEEDKNHIPLYYKVLRKQNKHTDHIDYSLAFVRGDEVQCYGHDETISITATCCNRDEAANLKIDEINQIDDETISSYIKARNITRPSLTLRPDIKQTLHWTTISNLALNYFSLLNKDALAQILRSYNMPALYSKQAERTSIKIIDNIESFTTKPVQTYYQDLLINGLESTIEIHQSAFNSEGELYLFGSVLARFYSLFATVNSFHHLVIVNTLNKESYQWPATII